MFQDRVVYIALYAVLLLPAVSFAGTWFFNRLLRLLMYVDSAYVVKKEEITIHASFINNGFISYNGVKVIFDNDDILITDIGVRRKLEHSFTMSFPNRGVYYAGVKSIFLTDPLGLFKFHKKPRNKVKITVYPRIIELDDVELLQSIINKSEAKLMLTEDDYTTVSDMRKYVDTDSYKKIHWKLSAKKNELIVKNYHSAAGNKTCLLLDINSSHIEIEDEMVELVVSFADKLLKENVRIELAYGYDSFIKTTGADASDFFEIYSKLAELQFGRGMETATALLNYTKEQDDFCTIVLFTHRLDNKLADAVLAVQAQAYRVMLMFFAGGNIQSYEEDILHMLKASGVVCKATIVGLL